MTRSISKKPAKTKRFRVSFIGPKGGYHHAVFTFKLNQTVSLPAEAGLLQHSADKMREGGWITRIVMWYNSRFPIPAGPHAHLLYRLHKNDIYNSRSVKAGWRIAGEY